MINAYCEVTVQGAGWVIVYVPMATQCLKVTQ